MVEESLADWLPVSEAATQLAVSEARVRQLVHAGALAARLVGGRYLVRRVDVQARLAAGSASGRPFSVRRAWGLILLAAGRPTPGLDAGSLWKLRAILRERDLWSMRSRLARRADRLELRAHRSDLAPMEAEADVVLTGARNAMAAGLELVAPDASVELYVDSVTADRLVERYRLQRSERPNVVLHVVGSEVRPWLIDRVAPWPAVALDLADDGDSRAQHVAREALTRR